MGARLIGTAGIKGEFWWAYEQVASSFMDGIVWTVDSNVEIETYPFLGASPVMDVFSGERDAKTLRESSFTIKNKVFSAALEFKKEELRRDKTPQARARIADLAGRAFEHKVDLIADLIKDGLTTTAYDGKNFFASNHSEGLSGSQSNLTAASATSATDPTADEFSKAIFKAIGTIVGLKDDQAKHLNRAARQFVVVVPTVFLPAAEAALINRTLSGGIDNLIPNQSRYKIEIEPLPTLDWTTKFAVFRTDGLGSKKPFILQEEVAIDFDGVAEGSELEKLYRKHIYFAEWEGNAAPGWWQLATEVTFS